jgi:hypothetical protein
MAALIREILWGVIVGRFQEQRERGDDCREEESDRRDPPIGERDGEEVGELGRFGCCSGWFGWSGPRARPRLDWPLPFLFFLSVSFFFLFLISVLVFENAIQI